MEFPTESHEIIGREFDECGHWSSDAGACTSTRRVAIRKQNLGLYCGAPQPHYHRWPDGRPWATPDDFADGGVFAGWVSSGAFPPRGDKARPKREREWQISPARRAQLIVEMARPSAKCMVCEMEPFTGERNSVES